MNIKQSPLRATTCSPLYYAGVMRRRTLFSTRLAALCANLHTPAVCARGSVQRGTVITFTRGGRSPGDAQMAPRVRRAVFFLRGSRARRAPVARLTSTPKP